MMRKLTTIALTLIMIFCLTSCASLSGTHDAVTAPSQVVADPEVEASTTEDNTASAVSGTVESNTDGDVETYVLTGTLTETFVVDTDKDVEITLNNVTANLADNVIKIKEAKSVTLILVGDNNLTSTLEDTKTIKSDVDLTIEGTGTLTITSADTCIKSDTNLTVNSGTLNLTANNGGDGLRSDETLTINGGTISIEAGEGLESTQITLNGGTISISASDDGINASQKSETLSPVITINGGNINIVMASGDTDAIDSNGSLVITGGTINISAQFAFDYETTVSFTGGTVYVNGEEVTQITNSMFGGGMMGGWGGPQPGQGNWGGQQPGGENGGKQPGQGGWGHP